MHNIYTAFHSCKGEQICHSFTLLSVICSISVILTVDFARQLSWISYCLEKLHCCRALSRGAFPELMHPTLALPQFQCPGSSPDITIVLLHQKPRFQLENGVTLWAHSGLGKLLKKSVGVPWKALSVIYLINKLIYSL